jgi:hypothetical protein
MVNFISRIKFNIRKREFIKRYQIVMGKSPEYEQFLQETDEKDINKSGLWCAEIYDVVDNSEFNKVIRRLYSLKNVPSSYKVDVNYRRKLFSQLQYARVEIDFTSTSLVGKIEFQANKYIRDITITKTQINNNEFILCYSIHLEKVMHGYKELHTCIMDNLNIIKKSKNCTWYSSNGFFEQKDNKQILELEFEWLRDWLQGIIEQLLYSRLGQQYRLPIVYNFNLLEKSDTAISELKAPFLTTCFSDAKEEQFLHIETYRRYDGCHIDRYTFGKNLTESHFLKYFSRYGNEFYYQMFNYIEIAEIERRLGRYFTSLKRKVSIDDQKWLINKIRALKERKPPIHFEEKDTWIYYYEGKKGKEQFINYPNYQNKYLEIYEQYLEYIRSINSLDYNSILLWVTGLTLISTIIGVMVTVLK